MATSKIKVDSRVVTVNGSGSGTISSANGYANIDVNFTPPSGGILIGESVASVGASSSSNDVRTFIKLSESDTYSRYRVVSSSAQTITIKAKRLYRIE